VKCLGGTIQAKLWPQKKSEFTNAAAAGLDLDAVLGTDDLVRSDNVFFVATGITDGELVRGVRYRAGGATTESLVMRSKSGTIRRVSSEHRLTKLRAYSSIDFEHHTDELSRPYERPVRRGRTRRLPVLRQRRAARERRSRASRTYGRARSGQHRLGSAVAGLVARRPGCGRRAHAAAALSPAVSLLLGLSPSDSGGRPRDDVQPSTSRAVCSRGVRTSPCRRAGSALSLVMRSKSGTIRRVSSEHRLTKLRAYSSIDFEHHTAPR
jgi:hypothetical protein